MTQTTWTEARIELPATEGGHAADTGLALIGPDGWVHVKPDISGGGGFRSYPPQTVSKITWKTDPWSADQ
ncbi:hypothetical protein ABT093_03870 [Kitasatospora sp. NPDC002551]|uniref:hypothetical protein n=1 Tax=unclassified Kitasatospora TaxID=2633591 RepID=UPI0033335F23